MQKSLLSIIQQSLIAIILLAGFQSCLGPKKMNKWVTKQYGDQLNAPVPKKMPDYLTVTSSLPMDGSEGSTGERKISHFLPLLVYWQWDDRLSCTLNPKIPVYNFTSTATNYAAKKGLKQKLGTQRVELHIDKMPSTFAIDDKAHLVWVIYAVGWDFVSIQPEKQDMVVSYRVLQGDTEVKKGTITVTDINKPIPIGFYQSVKKKTWSYLEDYDANIATMTRTVIDKLVEEL